MAGDFPAKWAILFGVHDYNNVKKLKYCTRDIVEIGKAFRKFLEFEDDHFLVFAGNSEAISEEDKVWKLRHAPEYAAFWTQLASFLNKQEIGENDLLFFYFSGHGFRDKKEYLLPRDASLVDLQHTGIEVEGIIDRLSKTKCRNIVLFLDACREEPPAEPKGGLIGIGAETETLIRARPGTVCFFSCDPQEQSWEIDDLKHGSFTRCVLDAVENGDCVTAEDVSKYLKKEVQQTNKKYGMKIQIPYVVPSHDDKMKLPIFASSAKREKTTKQYNDMIDVLYELYQVHKFKAEYYSAAVELLELAKNLATGRVPSETEAEKLHCIKMLCSKKFSITVFIATWDAIERRPPGEAVTKPPERKIQ